MSSPSFVIMKSDSFQYLSSKLIQHKIPIKDFRTRIQKVIEESKEGSGISLEDSYFLCITYTNQLRDFYTDKYRGQTFKNVKDAEKKMRSILIECKNVMEKSFPPKLPHMWSYEGALQELKADISDYFEDISHDLKIKASERKEKIIGRLRWVLNRLLLVLANFGQSEVQRRMSYRAAEKRLSEIPEFPLL